MSRIGQQPIDVPDDVEVRINGSDVSVSGPEGDLENSFHPDMQISYDEEESVLTVQRTRDTQEQKALHGTSRSLLQNMVEGVSDGFSKRLEIHGTGYGADMSGETLVISVGYTNDVRVDVPDGIQIDIPNEKVIEIQGANKQEVGQFASEVRSIRPPDPYNQKGIRYSDEHVRSKEGKKFVTGA